MLEMATDPERAAKALWQARAVRKQDNLRAAQSDAFEGGVRPQVLQYCWRVDQLGVPARNTIERRAVETKPHRSAMQGLPQVHKQMWERCLCGADARHATFVGRAVAVCGKAAAWSGGPHEPLLLLQTDQYQLQPLL